MTRGTIGWLLVGVQFLLLLAVLLLPWREPSLAAVVAGGALVVVGAVMLVAAMRGLGPALTPTPLPRRSAALRTDGPYRIVRHPIYLAIVVMAAGFALAVGSLWTWGGVLVLTAFLVGKSRWEDHLLAERYGQEWADWARRTGGLVPRPGRRHPGETGRQRLAGPDRRLSLAFAVVGLVALLIACLGTVRQYLRAADDLRTEVTTAAAAEATDLAGRLSQIELGATSLAAMMQEVLPNEPATPDGWTGTPTPDGWAVEQPDGVTVTGTGPVPADPATVAQVNASISLTPMYQAIRTGNPWIAWMYFTSDRGFVSVYPGIAPADFHFSEDTLDLPFWQGAVPEANPQAEFRWSSPYLDQAGAGLMISGTQPVVVDGTFVGAMSMDLTMAEVDRLLAEYPLPLGTDFLVDPDGREATLDSPRTVPVDQLVPGTLTPVGDDLVGLFPIGTTGWSVAAVVPSADIRSAALRSVANMIVFVLFLVVALVLGYLLIRSLQRVRYLSDRDALTGLRNRRAFDLAGEEAAARSRKGGLLSVALIDIDFFKRYNDRYGHQAGDHTLAAVAGALESATRDTDSVFRVGGEEFCVLVLLDGPDALVAMTERMLEAVRALGIPHEDSPHARVTISVGATQAAPDENLSLEEAYRRADDALYAAKEGGRDRCVMAVEAR